jgi:hypothetical protein
MPTIVDRAAIALAVRDDASGAEPAQSRRGFLRRSARVVAGAVGASALFRASRGSASAQSTYTRYCRSGNGCACRSEPRIPPPGEPDNTEAVIRCQNRIVFVRSRQAGEARACRDYSVQWDQTSGTLACWVNRTVTRASYPSSCC